MIWTAPLGPYYTVHSPRPRYVASSALLPSPLPPSSPRSAALLFTRALQLHREARMVSPVMGAAIIGTMYFLRANCAQHGGSVSGGGLISASLLSYRALFFTTYSTPPRSVWGQNGGPFAFLWNYRPLSGITRTFVAAAFDWLISVPNSVASSTRMETIG